MNAETQNLHYAVVPPCCIRSRSHASNDAVGIAAKLLLLMWLGILPCQPASGAQSIARVWNERALAAIRVDTPHPPAQARNYFSLSVCMYDGPVANAARSA